jgi:transposase
MGKLDDISMADLQAELQRADDPKGVLRLMLAIAYRDGVDVTTLSDRYDIPESTIYYWLDRFEERPLEEALSDGSSPGRPPKLSAAQRATLERWLQQSPREQDLDAKVWTPELVRRLIATEFGVDYSLCHVRRLLREEYEI